MSQLDDEKHLLIDSELAKGGKRGKQGKKLGKSDLGDGDLSSGSDAGDTKKKGRKKAKRGFKSQSAVTTRDGKEFVWARRAIPIQTRLWNFIIVGGLVLLTAGLCACIIMVLCDECRTGGAVSEPVPPTNSVPTSAPSPGDN